MANGGNEESPGLVYQNNNDQTIGWLTWWCDNLKCYVVMAQWTFSDPTMGGE